MLATATPDSLTLQQVPVQPAVSVRARRIERAALATLCLLYLICASLFAIVTPYGEAPDEHGHLLYIEHMVRYGQLPEIKSYHYGYDAFHPPLYYLVGATSVATGRVVVGTSLEKVLAPQVRDNPNHQAVAEPAVFLHPPEERWPLTAYALRGISILMGLGVIVLTYATARVLVPHPAPGIVPLLAAAFAALIPQANFIRASIANENGATLVAALIIWLLALHITRPHTQELVFWIGVALGLGLLTKLSVAPLFLPAIWVLWVRSEGRWRRFAQDMALVIGLVLVVAGWLYVYKWVVYGDPLALRAWREMLPPDGVYSAADLFTFFWFQEPFRFMLWTSFWGVFGWQQIFMPDWIYNLLIAVTLASVIGGIILLSKRALNRAQMYLCATLLFTLFLMYGFVIMASTYLVAWQGREMFPALSSICVLLGLGLGGLLLGKGAVEHLETNRARQRLEWGALLLVTGGLFALNIYSSVWLVLPALNT
jgi:4-amino-4-deoxy-L-arabinose transferase-like glycosyltransferase